jgi:hypothetical protein
MKPIGSSSEPDRISNTYYWTYRMITYRPPSFVSTHLLHQVQVTASQQELCSVHQDLLVHQLCRRRHTLLGARISALILGTGYCKVGWSWRTIAERRWIVVSMASRHWEKCRGWQGATEETVHTDARQTLPGYEYIPICDNDLQAGPDRE